MVTYGFFDSIDGDRRYNADDISNFFLKLISDGVFATPANAMQVQASSGMTVKVSPGWGFIKCKWIHNDMDCFLTLDQSDIILNRADRIVLRLNRNSRDMEIAVKKGTPGENAYAPPLQRDETIWELSLAYIYVWAGQTEITNADIADERWNADVCGWVTGLIQQIDTTNLFAQYDCAFWNWFNVIKNGFAQNATLVRQLSAHYITTTTNESVIAISNQEYVPSLDTLNVYVNGIRLTPDVDFSINISQNGFHTITLTKALDVIGTPVDFEILKSIYAEDIASAMTILIQLQQIASDLQERLVAAEEAVYQYSYPNIAGGDTLDASDAALIQSFTAGVGIGTYTNDLAGWAQFVRDNNLPENTSYPDANGDGVVDVQESSAILEFVANTAVRRYSNSKAGWNAFMLEKTRISTQTTLQRLSTEFQALKSKFVPIVSLTQEAYDALESPDENTLYVIVQAES
ncbi:MAG: hypothetical protein K2O42_07745 [Oscillospiraceae bacterium]|nr:hypothetical protein [Oscillospiraceae bacterium]